MCGTERQPMHYARIGSQQLNHTSRLDDQHLSVRIDPSAGRLILPSGIVQQIGVAMTGQHRLSITAIDAALAKSVLATLSPTLRDTLTHDALAVELPAGSSLYYEADQ